MIFIGIDPGASGGLVAMTHDRLLSCVSMPDTEKDTWNWFCRWEKCQKFAVIEKVGGYIGGVGSPGATMFKFGFSAGVLTAFLISASIPFEQVPPQKWQKALGCGTRAKTESKADWKNRLKGRAQALFPTEKVTLATADALLISEYCRRVHRQ